MNSRELGRRIPMTYFNLKNKDYFTDKWAKQRSELIIAEIVKIINKQCKGSFEDLYSKDNDPVYQKSNHRIDFMLLVYKNLAKYCSSKLFELEDERDRRTW